MSEAIINNSFRTTTRTLDEVAVGTSCPRWTSRCPGP